ncbi:MAG: ribonuclease HI family protein [Thermoanaerobaculia bacterium]
MTSPAAPSARAWIDGASRGNPGEAGFGVLLETDRVPEEIVGYLGKATNNVAEYAALIAVLKLAADRGVKKLVVYSDSQLLVRQVNGAYRVKAPHLVPIFLQALKLRQTIPDFTIEHVAREENKEADRLANQAIDLQAALPSWLELEVPSQ